MNVKIDKDEMYPFYSVSHWGQKECDVPKAILERWNQVMDDFNVIQDEMEAYYHEY